MSDTTRTEIVSPELLERQVAPILEYDPSSRAVVEPELVVKPFDVGGHCVLCFFHEIIERLVADRIARQIHSLDSAAGPQAIYEVEVGRRPVALIHPGVGAPMAAVTLEKMIALGCRKFIVVGGAGVLDRKAALGDIIVPDAALRDEGTSYHYLPRSREVTPAVEALNAIEATLRVERLDYVVGKVWTTDAFFRETRARVEARKREGCIAVEMEASALFAVARHRGVSLGQILYAGDVVTSESTWNPRNWQHASCRGRLLAVAVKACLRL